MDCDCERGGEYRVAGPPGCGKTTWLSRQITNAAQKHGSEEVFVSSFTKTAAVELVSRNLPIANSSVGTLHSHCYRAIGDPVIAELHIDDFNKDFPQFALSGSGNKPRMDEAAVDTATGDAESDQLFSQYNINRNKMIPRDQWSPKVQQFAGAWDDFKSTNGLMDFTDLVETAYYDFKTAPNNPSIGFIDECQDLTPLQFALVRKWGKSMNYFILVGDADQCLFSFSGASPEPFMTPLEQGHKITLKQSYRVPVKPHALALKWIRRCRRREDVEYYPTQLTGSVNKNKGSFQNPEPVIDAAETDLAAGKTVMILASCAYQLQATIAILRKRGIPFHNPYRTSRGDWNPLLRRGGKSSSDRLLAYLEPAGPLYAGEPLGPIPRFWTPQQFALWTDFCKSSGILNRGAKQALKDILAQAKSEPLTDLEMSDLIFEHMQMDAIPEALKLDPQWLISKLLAPYRARLDFPLKVYETHGREALVEQPKLIVGTIHSSKGGEAQSIYLYPDVSLASWKAACESDIGYDSLIRQCYVGLTRCSEKLTMCSPETERHFGRL